jgi:hypothetical protein
MGENFKYFTPEYIQSLTIEHFFFLSLICSLATLALFYLGFRFFRHLRIFQDTPTAKIRSASQGFVELVGVTKSLEPGPKKSPYTRTDCAWYKYEKEKYVRSLTNSKSNRWETVEKGESSDIFYIDDDTGLCIVDPEEAKVIPQIKKVWRKGDIRYTEERIHENSGVYCLGQFESEQGPTREKVTRETTKVLLNSWKEDRNELLRRFDLNKDGEIDMSEWNAARKAARKQAQAEVKSDYSPTTHHTLIKPFDKSLPYIISGKSQKDTINKYLLSSGLCFLGFFAIGSYTTFIFLSRGVL